MLDIPGAVASLYKKDGVHKNLRIHFPNGELSDLMNENVLYESLTFKESICSQEAFKFGLCEAAEISFETVGVGNMIDMVIEAFIEIDVSSLSVYDYESKKWINNYTGIYGQTATNEGERLVYSIPLGTFVVSSCPRSQSDMSHRQVTAYTTTFNTNDDMGVFPNWIISQLHKTKKKDEEGKEVDGTGVFTMYLPQFMEMACKRNDWEDDYIESLVTPATSGIIFPKKYLNDDTSYNQTKFCIAYGCYIYCSGFLQVGKDDNLQTITGWQWKAPYMYSVSNGPLSYSSFRETVKTIIGTDPLDDVLQDFYYNYMFGFFVVYSANVYKFVTNDPRDPRPYLIYDAGLASTGRIQIASRVEINNNGSKTTVVSSFCNVHKYAMKLIADDPKFMQMNLLIDSNLATEDGTYRFSFYNAFTFKDILTSYLELHALFGNQERDGSYTWFRISKENPIPYTPEMYESLWWDEYDVDNVGHVLYTFKNGDSDEEVNYPLQLDLPEGETATSIYDLRNNKIFDFLEGKSKDKIQQIIDLTFKSHLPLLSFIPVDMTAIGLPHIEDGDYLEIVTKDGEILPTFVLSRSISGIQTLKDDILSSSGEIIAADDYETPDSGDN